MDGNKDEALRCFSVAKDAIAAGNKQRALKFLGIAARLNKNLPLDNLFAACKNLDSYSFDASSDDVKKVSEVKGEMGLVNGDRVLKGERSYTEEHADLVWEIKSKKDYYSILGLERSCSVEEIRKAYRKLSLKVHPDKNKAPGSEEAFKKISKAFKCLSDDESRRQYDEMGLIDEFEYNEQHSGSWSWRTERDFSDDDFHPDEVFSAFFDCDMFGNFQFYRHRTANVGDDMGSVDEFEYNEQHSSRRRWRTESDFSDDDFDPDKVFRAFVGHRDTFGNVHFYRHRTANGGDEMGLVDEFEYNEQHSGRWRHTTANAGYHQRESSGGAGSNLLLFLQLLPFLVIILLAYLPFSDPEYSLQKNYSYQFKRMTEKMGVEFFVKSAVFDENYPVGSPRRNNIEHNVIKDYKDMLGCHCQIEMQRHHLNMQIPTPHCDRLESLVA
ncbi:UNVERIFIED_CONTAM: Chaperone protein dnaJ 49 [Sesamum angustifolium]|uniref:Chaperone protein dnaJ 49 n=1 Tax=Sesamum angustifolium TaxID=2727405 RepID=A0AAW2LXJ3_9LAMI